MGRLATEHDKDLMRRRYAANPEFYKFKSALYRFAYPDEIKVASVRYYSKNRELIQERSKRWRDKLRQEMIVAYGGHCSLCEEAYSEFLCLDHINGGGGTDRANGLYGLKLYSVLRRQGWPSGKYRLLCHNCNMSLMLIATMSVPQPVRQVKYTRKVKSEVIRAYGGKCECCGESDSVLLAVDHIYGGGQSDRAVNGRGRVMYARLKMRGWPKEEYRLLCHNCNMSIGFFGYCPHTNTTTLLQSGLWSAGAVV